MREPVAGVRFEPHGPLVFCQAGAAPLFRGQRVLVRLAEGTRVGVVAVAPEAIIAAPDLPDAPRVVGVVPAPLGDGPPDVADVAPDVVFLPADDGPIGRIELARALALSDLPVPVPARPPERR